mmetsp:Transcript_4190/g.9027  ORF Transcript_4190/g.9027 Transcript_4190/m.9027 type:complete len:185 (-) Transcript_4190:138-692(-)
MAKANVLAVVIACGFVAAALPSAFVMPGSQSASPSEKINRQATREGLFVPFESATPAAAETGLSPASIVAVAASFGLAFGLLAAPVRAEEEVTSRAARKARRAAALKAEQAEEKAASQSSSGFSLPSFPNPFDSTPAPAEAKKVVVADDDRSPVASDPVALFLIFFTLPTIYLVFYVLGSIDVI